VTDTAIPDPQIFYRERVPAQWHPPFLTLRQNRAAYERLVAEVGGSAMAMLGGLSGLAGGMQIAVQLALAAISPD
jgi:hypothetical protein